MPALLKLGGQCLARLDELVQREREQGTNIILEFSHCSSFSLLPQKTRTVPVKYSSGPLPEGGVPFLLSSISQFLRLMAFLIAHPISKTARTPSVFCCSQYKKIAQSVYCGE